MSVKAIPDGYRSITPGANLKDAAKAVEFYKKAFGAEEIECHRDEAGLVRHCVMQVGDSRFMVGESIKDPVHNMHVMLYVQDSDAVFKAAVDAGATVKFPLADKPWGDRGGQVVDPCGNHWFISTHKEDVPHDEIMKRMMKLQAGKA